MRTSLIAWYHAAKRDLPWRRTTDPYAITVSELMLQQTQVVTVIPFYERWLKTFPTWAALAAASETQVLKAWEGLGYYRRARNLQALARVVAGSKTGMPRDGVGLLALPGIGPYTAAAVGSIAFRLPLAVLDGNVMRVLTRLLAFKDDIALPAARRKLQEAADAFLEKADPSSHNQAMMELGATICVPRKPLCLLCPLKRDCLGKSHAEDFPVKTRVTTIHREETVAIIQRGEAFYCEQVPEGKPWHGLWRFPDFDPVRMKAGEGITELRYGITKYAVTMKAVSAIWKVASSRHAEESPQKGLYLTPKEMQALAFASPHRKMAGKLTNPNPSS